MRLDGTGRDEESLCNDGMGEVGIVQLSFGI